MDVQVTLNEEGRLIADLYTKPTDTHQYLYRQSCHPHHCKTTITYSQALHLRRICSRDEDYHRRVQDLKSHLVSRRHGEMDIQRQIDKAKSISRKEALRTSGKKTTDRIPLVVGYHPDVPPLSKILRNHLPIHSPCIRKNEVGSIKPPLVPTGVLGI